MLYTVKKKMHQLKRNRKKNIDMVREGKDIYKLWTAGLSTRYIYVEFKTKAGVFSGLFAGCGTE